MRRALSTFVMAAALLAAGGCETEDENDWVPITFDDEGDKKSRKDKKKSDLEEEQESGDKRRSKPTTRKTTAPKPTATKSVSSRDARAIERSDKAHLRGRARSVHRTLVTALPRNERSLVENIPFVIDNKRGSVNAFAACLKDGRALVAVSDGLMQVQAQLARAKATDEVFGTNKLGAYLDQLSRSRNLLPPKNFISAARDKDPRKRARQAQLLDEGLAFVIGHELAHHRLSHTGCVGHDHGHVTSADLGRALSSQVPMFNQPNELASDVYGTQNVLRAGQNGTGWTEGGGLLMLRFFRARTGQSLESSLVFGFERTHPHPDLRIPAVEQTARTFRITGGRTLPKIPLL